LRTALISAIAGYVDEGLHTPVRAFLAGLSKDELQYIAEYLGACVLESTRRVPGSRREIAESIASFDRLRSKPDARTRDQEHKMVMLLECLCRCELTSWTLTVQRERARTS
jgi:hypothetical protein